MPQPHTGELVPSLQQLWTFDDHGNLIVAGNFYTGGVPDQTKPGPGQPLVPGPGGGAGGFGQLAFLNPSGKTSGAADAAALRAVLDAGRTPVLTGGAWYLDTTIGPLSTGQWIVCAPGVRIAWLGTGDCFRWTDPSIYDDRTIQGGGITGRPIIDGAGAGAGSAALHAGDILGFRFDIAVQNFTGAGDIGIHLDNQAYWTEQAIGLAYISNCTRDVVFDCGGADTAAGSFDRGDFTFWVQHKTFTGGVVTWQNGANQVGGWVRVYGNVNSSAAPFTEAVLALTGQAPAGHPASFSGLQCGIDVNVESDEGEPNTFQTINFGSADNTITDSFGSINFGSGNQFTSANITDIAAQFTFLGPVVGDTQLEQCTIPTRLNVDGQTFIFSSLYIGEITPAPPTPSGGGLMYTDTSGNLHYLGPGGLDTELAGSAAPPLAASASVTPADPAGTTSTALVMMGLGSSCKFTPQATGKVLAVITCAVHATGTAEPCTSAARFGTGTAPANGAASAGTKFGVGADTDYFTTSNSSAEATPVTFQQVLTLTPGTAYWFDLAIATSNAAGTAVATAITATFAELGVVTTDILAVLGALGGAAVFVGAVITVARGIFRQITATEANTAALDRLTGRYDNHETRISRLEGRP